MKKVIVLSVVVAAVILAIGTAGAKKTAEEKGDDLLIEKQAETDAGKIGRQMRSMPEKGKLPDKGKRKWMDRGMMYKMQEKKLAEKLAKKEKEHGLFIAELTAIKKLAEEEKAPKTAERLQKLIDKRKGIFEKSTKGLRDQLTKVRQQAEKLAQEKEDAPKNKIKEQKAPVEKDEK